MFDVVVIGGGPAGYVAAVRLAQHGLKVALIERRYLGGECTNWGCIPSKALIEVSRAVTAIKHSVRAGIEVEVKGLDSGKLMRWVRKAVVRSREGVRYLLSEVKLYEGVGRVKSPKEVIVESRSGRLRLETEYVVIATGTEPAAVPGLKFDGERVISNRDFFELDELPSSVLIIGAGAIGTELGAALANLGVEVHIVEIKDRPLPDLDPEVSGIVAKYLRRAGVNLMLSSIVKGVEARDGSVVAKVATRREVIEVPVDKVLIAAGRRYNVEGLGAWEVGVEIGPRGCIRVNEVMRTSVPNIYAVGDITGPPLLAHKAFREGLIAAEAIAGGRPPPRCPVPEVIYTTPEVARVGLTEVKASEAGLPIRVVRFPYTAVPRDYTSLSRTPEGFVKLIVDRGSGKVLGATVVGNSASELIHSLCIAVANGLSLEDLARASYPHPTFSEAIGEAAHLGLGRPVHLKGRT